MLKVSNGKCIRRLAMRSMGAARTRNAVAVLAIALTTLLFTALFTIGLSLNSSYEEYTLRQIGGYSHGSFKEVGETEIAALSAHPKVREFGLRATCGFTNEPPFAKKAAEVSWMDANTAKWSYITPTAGRLPESGLEVAMDTAALEKLGVPARLGAQVELTYRMGANLNGPQRTDVFTLVGFWEYDPLAPVHYINISRDHMERVRADYIAQGGGEDDIRTDMNVMLSSRVNIRGTMEEIDTDLGYQWEERDKDNCVRIGVNWGYTGADLTGSIEPTMILAIAAFLALVIFTGYLIIYNIFQISVTNDIRFYGMLKTIGATPRQLRRLVRLQALALTVIGIPVGCLAGYGIGGALLPTVLERSIISVTRVSTSPVIFLASAAFAVLTVLLSCARPARHAGRITPVEALRYTEGSSGKAKRKATRGAKVWQMALANLSRSRAKTAVVVLSLSLAVVLFNCLTMFVGSFDMEKYVSNFSTADFLVGAPEVFRYQGGNNSAAMPEADIEAIRANVDASLSGVAWASNGHAPTCWVSEETFRECCYLSTEMQDGWLAGAEYRADGLLSITLLLEGLDESLLPKLRLYDGDLAPLTDPSQHAIAIPANKRDDGSLVCPLQVGDTLTIRYVEEARYCDTRTGQTADDATPGEFIQYQVVKSHDVDYTVCALVGLPYSMSFRISLNPGLDAVLTADALRRDSGAPLRALYHILDTPTPEAEAAAEAFLADYTAGESSGLMYESKALLRAEFRQFQSMFLLVGGMLCFVVAVVGVLNFFNAILTGILARKREFAVLQSVGMTGRQLKTMLVCEGLFYALGAGAASLALTAALSPLLKGLLESLFWFVSFRFSLAPMAVVLPVFALLGVLVPLAVHTAIARSTIVERLRQAEG